LLDNWSEARLKFVKVFPNEYKRALIERKDKQLQAATETTRAQVATNVA
jgi:glutamate synthase (ferredoxin)